MEEQKIEELQKEIEEKVNYYNKRVEDFINEELVKEKSVLDLQILSAVLNETARSLNHKAYNTIEKGEEESFKIFQRYLRDKIGSELEDIKDKNEE